MGWCNSNVKKNSNSLQIWLASVAPPSVYLYTLHPDELGVLSLFRL